METNEHGDLLVPVVGHYKRLSFSPGPCSCGHVENGVSFRFEGEGCWVIDLDVLRELVDAADAARFKEAIEITGATP